jgi:hypothetical protein
MARLNVVYLRSRRRKGKWHPAKEAAPKREGDWNWKEVFRQRVDPYNPSDKANLPKEKQRSNVD